jgi:colanic acid/amylovoran biosynthesis glycosyltransferase
VDLVGAWTSREARRVYEGRARALGIHDVLIVHGGVEDRAVVRGLLGAAHVLAFPSTYATEGLPLAVIEALGAGTPVVTTRHAGLEDLVDHDRSGMLVDIPPDPASLSQAILDTLTDDAWPRLARGARAAYEKRFMADVVRRSFLAALLGHGEGVSGRTRGART